MADEPTATSTATATFAAAVAADVTILRAEKAAAKAEAAEVAAAVAVCPTTTTTTTYHDENYYRAFAVLNKRVPIKNTDKQQLLLDFAQLDIPSFMCNEDDGEDSTTTTDSFIEAKNKIKNIYNILPKEKPSITILNKSWQKDFTATNIASLYSNWKIYKKLTNFYYSESRTTTMHEDDKAVLKFLNDFEKMMDEYIITQTAQDNFLHLKIENANKRKRKEAHTMQQHITNTVAARKKPRLPITSGNGQVSTLPVSLSAVTAALPATSTTTTSTRNNHSNSSRTKAIVFENDNNDIETVICPCDGINDDTNLLEVMKIAQRNCSTIFTLIDDATLQKRFKMELQIIQSSSSSMNMNMMNIPISINNAKTLTVYDLFNFGISNDNSNNGSSTSSSSNNNNNGYSMCKIKIITGGFSDNTTL